jgi:hypothetical protein
MSNESREIRELTAEALRPILNEDIKTNFDPSCHEIDSSDYEIILSFFRKHNLSIYNISSGEIAHRSRPALIFNNLADMELILNTLIELFESKSRFDISEAIKNIIGSEFLVYQGEKMLHDDGSGFIEINKRIISASATWSLELENNNNTWYYIIKMPFSNFSDLLAILKTWPKYYNNN